MKKHTKNFICLILCLIMLICPLESIALANEQSSQAQGSQAGSLLAQSIAEPEKNGETAPEDDDHKATNSSGKSESPEDNKEERGEVASGGGDGFEIEEGGEGTDNNTAYAPDSSGEKTTYIDESNDEQSESATQENNRLSELVYSLITDSTDINCEKLGEWLLLIESDELFEKLLTSALDKLYIENKSESIAKLKAILSQRASEIFSWYEDAKAERESSNGTYDPGKIIVEFTSPELTPAQQTALSELCLTISNKIGRELNLNFAVIKLPARYSVARAASVIKKLPFVKNVYKEQIHTLLSDETVKLKSVDSVKPESIKKTQSRGRLIVLEEEAPVAKQKASASLTSNDPYFADLWHFNKINVPDAWEALAGESYTKKIKVAVIDTGADMEHEDLQYALNPTLSVELGGVENCPLSETGDSNGHGTHVCGIIASSFGNGKGTAGVASGADNDIVDLIAIGADINGSFYTSDLIESIEYAVNAQCRVINMSLGGPGEDSALESAINAAVEHGSVVVCAAGNDESSDYYNPSDAESAISVISTTNYSAPSQNAKAQSSNYGALKDISAPGVGIASTTPNDTYSYYSGTSMAAPVVSAVVAMMFSVYPQMTPQEAKTLLYDTATDLYTPGFDDQTAWGNVNAALAVKAAASMKASRNVKSIQIINTPASYEYLVDSPISAQMIDFSGMELKVIYEDESEIIFRGVRLSSLAQSGAISISSPSGKFVQGTNLITLTFAGASATFELTGIAPNYIIEGANQAGIETNGQTEIFCFVPTVTGDYCIYSKGSADTKISVFRTEEDTNRFISVAQDDSSGVGDNFYVSEFLNSGKSYYLYISYADKSATGTIDFVIEPLIAPIAMAVTTLPEKTVYDISDNEETLDLSKMILTFTFSDSSTEQVAGEDIDQGFMNREIEVKDAGSFYNAPSDCYLEIIRISYADLSDEFYLIWSSVKSLEIISKPLSRRYLIGSQAINIDDGLKIKINYSASPSVIVGYEEIVNGYNGHDFQFSYNLIKSGQNTVTIYYDNRSVSYEVSGVSLTSFQIINQPDVTEYYVGESELDLSGLSVSASVYDEFGDSFIEYARVTDYSEASFLGGKFCVEIPGQKIKSGINEVGLSLKLAGQKSVASVFDTIIINGIKGEAVDIKVSAPPKKLTYQLGAEIIDYSGLKVSLTYPDSSTKVFDIGKDGVCDTSEGVITASLASEYLTLGKNTVTLNYKDLSTSFELNCVDSDICGIALMKLPSRLKYYVGSDEESLDLSGMKLRVQYCDNRYAIYDYSSIEANDNAIDEFYVSSCIENAGQIEQGKNKIIIEYAGFTDFYYADGMSGHIKDIQILSLPLSTRVDPGLMEINPIGLSLKIIDEFDNASIVTFQNKLASYIDPISNEIEPIYVYLSDEQINPGDNEVTVQLFDKKISFTLFGAYRTVETLSITAPCSIQRYPFGTKTDELNLYGLELSVEYTDNTNEVISGDSLYALLGNRLSVSIPGGGIYTSSVNVTLTFGGKTAEFVLIGYDRSLPVSSFSLSVTGGSGSGVYPEHSAVLISAQPEKGYCFKRWETSEDNICYVAGSEGTPRAYIEMPQNDVTINAVYELCNDHRYTQWQYKDETTHLRTCLICKKEESAPHDTFSDGGCSGEHFCSCGIEVKRTHNYSQWEYYDVNSHKRVCTECGNCEYENHVLQKEKVVDFAAGLFPGVCHSVCEGCGTICGYEEIPAKSITLSAESASYSSIRLTWNALRGASGYKLYRATSKNGTYSLIATLGNNHEDGICEYINTKCTTTKAYYYKIRAFGYNQDRLLKYSIYSAVAAAKAMMSKPELSAVQSGTGKVNLTWQKVSGAAGYVLYRSSAVNSSYKKIKTISGGSTLAYVNSSLSSNKTYLYIIKAYRMVGKSKVYSPYSERITICTSPGVVTLKAQSLSYDSVRLSFLPTTGASGYILYRAKASGGNYEQIARLPQTAVSYIDTGEHLINSDVFYYKMRAFRTEQSGDVPGSLSKAVAVKAICSSPVLTAAPIGANTVKLAWDRVNGAIGYRIYRASSSKGKYTCIGDTPANEIISASLETMRKYYYKVYAYRINQNNVRVYSGASSISVRCPLDQVGEVCLAPFGSGAIKITFPRCGGAEGYRIYRATSENGEYKKIVTLSSGASVSFTDKGLSSDKTYYYKLRPFCKVASTVYYGSYTPVKSVLTSPGKVSLSGASTGINSVELKIKAALSGADHYDVYRAENGSSQYVCICPNLTSLIFVDSEVVTGRTYSYKIRAVNAYDAKGSFSSSVSVRPVPRTPRITYTQAGKKLISIEWQQTDAVGYVIYRATSKTGKYAVLRETLAESQSSFCETIAASSRVKYYYKLRPYYQIEGVSRIYGSYSAPVLIIAN